MLTIEAPAKLNLTLEVLSKRADGYHEILSVIQTVNLCDKLRFELDNRLLIRCDQSSWMVEKSLIYRAAGLLKETSGAIAMVIKFMALAFLLEALIVLYLPQGWITAALGQKNPLAIALAAILGVPAYTSNLTALPMISGLLTQGMNPAAARAFMIAGPTTTLPAMAAVWPLVSRRVFGLYVTCCLAGAVLMGYFYRMAALWF